MTITSRLAKLERWHTPRKFYSSEVCDYPHTLETLAAAITEITGQETTPAEIENRIKDLKP